jgi:hypothetical protein
MKILIHNLETGEIFEREMNQDELDQRELDKQRVAGEQAEAQAKEAAREAILDRLGITADEAAILLG